MQPSTQKKYFLVVLVTAVVLVATKLTWSWRHNRAILRDIERVTQVALPNNYSSLEIEEATEFSYVGKMKIKRSDIETFMQQMKFSEKTDFLALSTWGPYKDLFKNPEQVRGFLGVYGRIDGRNGWEFAYDPATEQMWFFMGYSIK